MSDPSFPGKSSPKNVCSFLCIRFELDFEPVLLAVVTLATDGLLSSPKYGSAGDSLTFVFPVNPVPGRWKAGDRAEPVDIASLESS